MYHYGINPTPPNVLFFPIYSAAAPFSTVVYHCSADSKMAVQTGSSASLQFRLKVIGL